MPTLPRDVTDLHLAPVVLALDARLEELSGLTPRELAERVAVEANLPDWYRDQREDAVVRASRTSSTATGGSCRGTGAASA